MFKDDKGEPRVWSHGINESSRGKSGAFPLSYRWWLHWPGNCLGIEYYLFRCRCAATITFDDTADDDVGIRIAIPFIIDLFISLGSCQWLLWLLDMTWQQVRGKGSWYYRREIGFSIFDKALWIYPWINPHEGGPRDTVCIRLDRILLGRQRHRRIVTSVEETVIVMPEGRYPATVGLFVSEWKYPRWPRAKRMLRADIQVPGGIPVPGKGDNSWDMDDNAIYSIVCPASTTGEAVLKFYESVMRTRVRYASANWKPADGWPAHCGQS